MTVSDRTAQAAPKPSSRAAAGLATLSAAQFLIALDFSVIFVALPSMGADLALSESAVQWVVSAYAVFFAGFLVLGGRAADRIGARTLFVAALLLFGVASLAGGIAQGAAVLLVARAAQGVAAATLQPSILALVNTTFEPGPARTRALAVWGTVGASGLAAGVVLGGLLTTVSWRWTFLVNLPFALVCVLAAPKVLPAPVRLARTAAPLNVVSAVLCTATVLVSTLGLTRASEAGWGDRTALACFAATAVLLAAFLLRERSSAQPLVAPVLRRTRTLLAGCGAAALYMASVAGVEFYLVTLALQDQRGFTPLQAGIAFLPLAVCITLGNTVAGRLLTPWGVRRTLSTAFLLGAAGLVLLALSVGLEGYAAAMLPGLLVSGIGHGMIYTSMFVGGTRDVPDSHQGTAGALMTTSQYAGGALGVAVLVLVLGTAPDTGSFAAGFTMAGGIALVGAVLAWTSFAGGARQSATAGTTAEVKA
ncbi:MFS transporter [Streptomyces sp. HB2AG]|uniref:MFS transporter n=1 Tax=Streptomyces sp. HB2AG TaxID=2983400 RepID=UPI0022AA0E06|nr:MFS transporter [Streptomyces sp. HB2AG]MCZ2523115.1 MFS transporter [Streptomyces sp. HB2AG]